MTTTMNTLNSNTTLLMTNTTSMRSLCSLSMGMSVLTVSTVGMRWCRQNNLSKGEDLT